MKPKRLKEGYCQGKKIKDTRARNTGGIRRRATEANTELREEQAKIKKAATPVPGKGGRQARQDRRMFTLYLITPSLLAQCDPEWRET